MKIYNLNATLQKSYYGKAKVIYNDDGSVSLKSYDTIVCMIKDGNFVKLWNGYSVTTMKHINDFRKMFNLEPINKKAWDNLPCENTEKYKIVFSNGFVEWKTSTTFDDENDACEYADKVCENRDWRIGYDIIAC